MSTETPPGHAEGRRGLLVVGHGTQDEQGRREAQILCAQIAALCPQHACELSFLEHAGPTISQGLASLVQRGAEQVKVLPLLLFSAGHLQRDLPAAIAAVAARHTRLTWDLAPALADHPRLIELADQRFRQAIGAIEPAETALVVIGRGSRDQHATNLLRRIAEDRAAQASIPWCEVGFLAMAQPTVDEVLSRASSQSTPQVVVQPHLMFSGRLVDRVGELTQEAARAYPERTWHVAQHLGSSPLLAQALVQNAGL